MAASLTHFAKTGRRRFPHASFQTSSTRSRQPPRIQPIPPIPSRSSLHRHAANTTTPVSEIRSRFGIAESSVYRVSQRHGAPLRGRVPATAKPVALHARVPSTEPRRRPSSKSEAKTAVSAPQGVSQKTGGRARAGAARVATRRQVGERVAGASTRVAAHGSKPSRHPTTLPMRARSAVGVGAKARFRIRFQVEALFEAVDISDALRQAQSRGAIEVTAIVREN